MAHLPDVLKQQFIQPVMKDIEELNEISSQGLHNSYEVISSSLKLFDQEFSDWNDRISREFKQELQIKMDEDNWSVDDYQANRYPAWEYLLNHYQTHLDEYLINKNETNTHHRYQNIHQFHHDIIAKFAADEILEDIFSEINSLVLQAGKKTTITEEKAEEKVIPLNVGASVKNVSPDRDDEITHPALSQIEMPLLAHALSALDQVKFKKTEMAQVELFKALLRNNLHLQQALSASYLYLTKEKTGWTHGRHGEWAMRHFIRKVVTKLEDKSPDSIRTEFLNCINSKKEYARWFWDAGTSHHKRSRVAYALDSGMFGERNKPFSQETSKERKKLTKMVRKVG